MNEPLDELYLTWLYKQHSTVRTRQSSRTYWKLTKQLFTKEFIWFVPNDDNRVEDGKALRLEFLTDERITIHDQYEAFWLAEGCSVLEMLIGLSRRLAFEADGKPKDWFWHLINNLGLLECNDKSSYDEDPIDQVLERLVWRQYAKNGQGGLFPLRSPNGDQTKVEIWYQMCDYLLEPR